MSASDSEAVAEDRGDSPSSLPWQFSLRSLFVVTTTVSILLAIGVHYGGFMVVAIAAGVILVGTLLSADWLIRPQHRRALAFVTASAWIVNGSGIAMLGIEAFVRTSALGKQELGWPVGAVLIAAGLFCYAIAAWRWVKLAPKSTEPPHFDGSGLESTIQQ